LNRRPPKGGSHEALESCSRGPRGRHHLRHIIFNCATPVSDGEIQVVQILFRNDGEEDCSTQELIDWDAAIIAEDREILESTDPDAIVDMSRKIEMHMPSDRPGMLMRKRLNALFEAHGETEAPRHA
jgi:hypothetical protein